MPDSINSVEVDDRYRLAGYGEVQLDRALACTDVRVTLIGWGMIAADEAHAYEVPLPDELATEAGYRRLTATLGWLTPIQPNHGKYRKASLWLTDYREPKEHEGRALLNVDRQSGRRWHAARRGTLQHEIFEGDKVAGYEHGTSLPLQVNCAEDAGAFRDRVPYAIAATLEVAPELNIEIYEEIRAKIRQSVLVRPRDST